MFSRIVFAFVCDLLEVWTFDNARHCTQGACADTVWRFWVWRCSMSATEGQRRPWASIGLSWYMLWCAPQARRCWMGKHAKMPKSLLRRSLFGNTWKTKRGERGRHRVELFGLRSSQCNATAGIVFNIRFGSNSQLSDCESLHMAAHFARFEALAAYYTCTAPWSLKRWQQICTWSSFLIMREYG